MGSRLSLGKAVNLSAGMWQSSVLLLTRTCTRQPIPPEALQILPPPGRKSSTQTFPAVTPSNHWHLRRWAHSVLPLRSFWQNLVVGYQRPLENRARLPFFFSVCLSLFKGSTLFWFKKPLIYPTANRTSSLYRLFNLFLIFVLSLGSLLLRARNSNRPNNNNNNNNTCGQLLYDFMNPHCTCRLK